jgi:hypothetical protein
MQELVEHRTVVTIVFDDENLHMSLVRAGFRTGCLLSSDFLRKIKLILCPVPGRPRPAPAGGGAGFAGTRPS